MSKKIKGITIELDGDASPLEKALKDVDKASSKTTSELGKINRALKFDEGNTVLLAQKQEVLQEAVQSTTKRLDSLKQAQGEVEKMFASGEIDAKEYREFRREIEVTEGKLAAYKNQVQSIVDAQDRLGNATKQLDRLFSATGTSIDDFAESLDSKLVRAIKDGRANANQLEQAFDEIGRAALGTNADIDKLRTTLQSLDSGGSLEQVKADLQAIEREAKSSASAVDGLSATFGALGGVVAGVGLKGAVDKALETSDLDAKIDVTFEVPPEAQQAIRDALIDVKKYGVDGEEALEGLRRQWALNRNATDATNKVIVEGAAAITKAYNGIDFKELIQETNEISGELNVSNKEALDLVSNLLKIGFPPEQLDIIAEYGGQLRRAGYEAREIQAILASAVSTNSWNIDNLLDGLKEGRIRAAELGAGLSNGLKDNLRGITNTVQAASDEQLGVMQEGFNKQEKALNKSLASREKSISKSHSQQQRALDKALNSESRALDKSLREQSRALDRAHNEKLKRLDAEYMAKLKVIDEERYNALKAIDDEIKALEDLTDAENKAAQAAENAEKRATLVSKVEDAKTRKNKEMAIEALSKFDEEMRLKAAQEERKEQIEVLKAEKDTIKDSFDERKDALKNEYDLKKEQLREIQSAEKEALSEQHAMQREALRERHAMAKEALSERLSAEMDAVREAHANELDSFKKMNAEKLDIAKNPPDSAEFKAIEAQLEGWGKAIAKGGEEGAKAFEEMTAWLNDIEDATLRNLIGVEIFGTMWEDQGDNIIDSILGADDALKRLEKSQSDVNKTASQMSDGSAAVTMAEAMGKLNEALKPLLDLLASVINFIAELMIKFPGWSALIVSVVSVIGILAGAFAALAPIVYTISTLFGGGAAGSGLMGIFSKIIPFITNIGTKLLPMLGRAFAILGGPVGWTIAIITTLIGLAKLIIKNWEPISKFFKNLWDGVVRSFESAMGGIKLVASSIMGFIKAPINEMIRLINMFIKSMNKLQIPDWVPKVGGKGLNIPEIPMLAKGTNYFRGGMAIVGEQGPELVTMPTGAKVHNNKKTQGMLGGDLVITGNNFVIREEADIHRVARELFILYERERRGS